MDAIQVASIIVAGIAASAAYASQRAAAKASTVNTSTNSRVEMEKEAYDRARKYDTDTIERQDREIEELRTQVAQVRTDNDALRRDNENLRYDNDDLKRRLARLEAEFLPNAKKEIDP